MIAGLNRAGVDWANIKRWISDEIGKAQMQLELCGLDAPATEKLRGEIAAYRRLISAAEDVPTAISDPVNYDL